MVVLLDRMEVDCSGLRSDIGGHELEVGNRAERNKGNVLEPQCEEVCCKQVVGVVEVQVVEMKLLASRPS